MANLTIDEAPTLDIEEDGNAATCDCSCSSCKNGDHCGSHTRTCFKQCDY